MHKQKLEYYINQGLSQRQIAQRENMSQTGVRYWLSKYNIKTESDRRGWTDEQLIEAVKSSSYISDVIKKLGLTIRPGNYDTVNRYIKKLNLDKSHFLGNSSANRRGGPKKIDDSLIFVEDSAHSRWLVKKRIIDLKLLPYECSECELAEWMGKHIVLILDHINGRNNDNRINNLRLLCPNCNSQQPTFCRKN